MWWAHSLLHVHLVSYRTEHREGKLPLVPAPWEDSFLLCPKAPTPFPPGQLFPLSLPLAGLGFFSTFWSRLRKCFHSIPVFCAPGRQAAVGLMSHRSAHTWPSPVLSSLASFTVLWCGEHELSWTLGIGYHPRLRPDGMWKPSTGSHLQTPPGG